MPCAMLNHSPVTVLRVPVQHLMVSARFRLRVQENLKAALLRGQGAEHAFRVAPAPGPDEVCTLTRVW